MNPVLIARWVAGALLAVSSIAFAQDYPTKPIQLIVGFAAGGPADGLARIVSQTVGEALKQPIIVENKAGAGGTIAAATVAKSTPDGHTLMLVSSGHAGNAAYYPNLSYETVKSFTPVGAVASSPVVIVVNASSSYKTIGDLLGAARKNPDKLSYATGGGATLTNLAAEALKSEARFSALSVPYKGSGPALTALLGGEVDFVYDTVSSAIGLIRSGKLRAIAVTSAKRSSVLPDVPTIAETMVPGFDVTGWFGVLAPAGTPASAVDKFNRELNRALKSPAVIEKLKALGADPFAGSPAQFGKLLETETARWSALIKRLNLRAE
jgi:tripartite-type tricarboxylate transporter receptor subunit TctC